MKLYVDIEEFQTVDELLDHAEFVHGPGTFVIVGRMGKRNVGAFDSHVAAPGEAVVWPGEHLPGADEIKHALSKHS